MSWGRGENLYQIFSNRSTRHCFNLWWYNSKKISSCCPPPFRALQIHMDMWTWFRNVANRVLSASTDGVFCGIKAVACVLKPQPREKTAAHATIVTIVHHSVWQPINQCQSPTGRVCFPGNDSGSFLKLTGCELHRAIFILMDALMEVLAMSSVFSSSQLIRSYWWLSEKDAGVLQSILQLLPPGDSSPDLSHCLQYSKWKA